MCISKKSEFLQDFKNHAGDKSKFPKQVSPEGIRRVAIVCDIQATIECSFSLERVRDMIKTYSQYIDLHLRLLLRFQNGFDHYIHEMIDLLYTRVYKNI